MAKIHIIAGSRSDDKIVERATRVLKEEGTEYRVDYCSVHREPDRLKEIVKNSEAKVFICMAGLSAALPGAVAAMTQKPVIGVPVNVKLDGLDALLSMMQMPTDIPVAMMNKAAAIICDIGGMTSHPSILSRELGIPCVVSTKCIKTGKNITEILQDGDEIHVDGEKGEIHIL